MVKLVRYTILLRNLISSYQLVFYYIHNRGKQVMGNKTVFKLFANMSVGQVAFAQKTWTGKILKKRKNEKTLQGNSITTLKVHLH